MHANGEWGRWVCDFKREEQKLEIFKGVGVLNLKRWGNMGSGLGLNKEMGVGYSQVTWAKHRF